jgi:hypothetical protein
MSSFSHGNLALHFFHSDCGIGSWERAMAASPKEFREFAQECLRWADETKSERHRQVLLDMAKTWMQAALQLERSLALIDDDLTPPRRSQPRPAK